MGIRSQRTRKKLEAVARFWAGDREERIKIDSDVINGLIHANAPEEVIEAARRNSEKQNFQECEVWEENWKIFLFFLKVRTQWIIAPMGGYVGLNYQAIESIMNISRINRRKRKRYFDDLQIIEHEVLKAFNKNNN